MIILGPNPKNKTETFVDSSENFKTKGANFKHHEKNTNSKKSKVENAATPSVGKCKYIKLYIKL